MSTSSTPRVHAIIRTLDRNVSGLLTGFGLLHSQGRIRYTQKMMIAPPPRTSGPWHLRDKDDSNIELFVDNRATGFVDFHDSWELNEEGYRNHDVYIKRSLDIARLPPAQRGKVVPLGLIYEVWPNGFDRFEAARILTQQVPASIRAKNAARYLAHLGASWLGLGPRPNLKRTAARPDAVHEPRVLFQVGLWDPARVAQDDPAKAAEFDAVNQTRIGCVRALRANLPGTFEGGLQHSPYARSQAPDLLMPDGTAASKRRYLQTVRHHAICVATAGLHGSNGCKLAEYVSLSRAIISEPLRYSVPGSFAAGTHYLPFETAEECAKQALRLMRDDALRGAIMSNNWDYYNAWIRPDALAAHVLRSIRERN